MERAVQDYGERMNEIIKIGQLEGTFESTNRVYSVDGLCPTLSTCGGGNRQPMILEQRIVAMRGRNPDNPSERVRGGVHRATT